MADDKYNLFIKKIYKRYRLSRAFKMWLRGLILGLCLISSFYLFTRFTNVTISLIHAFIYAVIILPLILTAAGYFWPIPEEKIIGDFDRQAYLKEKLITFREYTKKEPDNAFINLLHNDLLGELKNKDAQKIFSLEWFPELKIIAFISILMLMFSIGEPLLSLPFSSTEDGEHKTADEGRVISQLGEELTRESLIYNSEDLAALGSKLTELGEKMQLSDADREKLSSRYEDLYRRVSEQFEKTEKKLHRRLEYEHESYQDPEINDRELSQKELLERALEALENEDYKLFREYREELKKEDFTPEEWDKFDNLQEIIEDMEKKMDDLDREGIDNGFFDDPFKDFYGDEFAEGDYRDDPQGDKRYLDEDEHDEDDIAFSEPGDFEDENGEEKEGYQEPENLEYELEKAESQLDDDTYLSTFLEELYPSDDFDSDIDPDLFGKRMLRYQTDIMNHLRNGHIPAAHRDIIRDYFLLISTK